MKNSLLALILLLFGNNLHGQLQVSDIEYLEYSYHDTPNLMEYNDTSYLVHRFPNETIIYKLKNDGVSFYHTYDEQPFVDRQSGLLSFDNIIVEFHLSGYMVMDFTEGTVLDTVYFSNEYKYNSYRKLIKDRFLVTNIWDHNAKSFLYVYDMLEKESHIIDFELSRYTLSDETIFFIDSATQICNYNLILNERDLIEITEDSIFSFGFVDDNLYIIDKNKIIHINDQEGIIHSIDCFSSYDIIFGVTIIEDYIFARVGESTGSLNLTCYIMTNCELMLETDNFYIQQSENYPEGFILLATFGGFESASRFKWLSTDNFDLNDLDVLSSSPFTREVVIGNKFYKVGNYSSSIGEISSCYVYDFTNNTTIELSLGNGKEYKRIDLAYNGNDHIYFFAITTDNIYKLWN